MSRIAYVNGRYLPHALAQVHIEDRGFQFSDGVYEVCEVRHRMILDMTGHLNRLERSLGELQIKMPMHRRCLVTVLREVAQRNRLVNGFIYLQVNRGVYPRDHVFPPPSVSPSLVITARNTNLARSNAIAEKGVAVITVPENRWERVDIKTVGLLANVLAKQKARENGASEAWFVDTDGFVTEGGSSNSWIVSKEGVLITRPAESGILRGITRGLVIDLAAQLGLTVEQRAFTPDEAKSAREAFLTAASAVVMPVVMIDHKPVANGHPGELATRLRSLFFDHSEKLAC